MKYFNIVIPIAGKGQRFKDAGYTEWKPFIDIMGKPMIQRAIESLPNGKIILVTGKGFETEGATNTVLLVEDLINNNTPLIIASCDQIYKAKIKFGNEDGAILTFKATDRRWSYVRIMGGYVVQVAEKQPISDDANVGVYYWKKGSDFVKYAKQMIAKNIRTNGEFYNAPVYNEAIEDGLKIKAYQVDKMWGVGTPEDLRAYVNSKRMHKIIE